MFYGRYKVLSAGAYLFCRRLLRALVCNNALHSFVLLKITIKHSKIISSKSTSLASRSLPLNSKDTKTSSINKTNSGRVHCMQAAACLCDVTVYRHLLCDVRTFFAIFATLPTPMEEKRKLMEDKRNHHGAVEKP